MSIPDLVNLANDLSHTSDEPPQMKITTIPNLQLQQLKAPKQNQTLLVSAIIAKIQDIVKEIIQRSFCNP